MSTEEAGQGGIIVKATLQIRPSDYARTKAMTTDLAKAHYPDAVVARALVLAAEGHSIRRIESDLANEFPNEVTPSREAVRRWAAAYADTCREEEGDRVQRIITLADDAVVAGLHGVRESEHPEKYIIPANAVAGTYRDKRDRTGGKRQGSFVRVRTSDGTVIEAGAATDND